MTTITLRCRNGCDCVSIIMMVYLSIDLYSRSSDNSRLTHKVSLELTHIVSFKTKNQTNMVECFKIKIQDVPSRQKLRFVSFAELLLLLYPRTCPRRSKYAYYSPTRTERTDQRTERTRPKKDDEKVVAVKLTVCRSKRNSKANCKMNKRHETNHVGKSMNGQSRS
jgi:hypothetical protein